MYVCTGYIGREAKQFKQHRQTHTYLEHNNKISSSAPLSYTDTKKSRASGSSASTKK